MSRNGSNMVMVKVRFTQDTLDILDELAKSNHISRADLIRRCVAGNLSEYFGSVRIMGPDQEREIKTQIAGLFDAISRMNYELNKLGTNYNQEMKLANQKGEHPGGGMMFPKDAIEAVMTRFERAAREVFQVLCRLLS